MISLQTAPAPDRRTAAAAITRGLLVSCSLGLVVALLGCTTFWDQTRERERIFALENARTQTGRGQCAQALASLDRAQARLDLGLYARESTLARVRCYEKLGMNELASAHRRLAEDFYSEEPLALPEPDGSSIFRVKTVSDGGFSRPPSWLKIPAPRYSPYAQRSDIVGRVVVSFELAGNDRPRKIRILEMPHPLLASWTIEAIASAEPKKKKDTATLMPGGRYVTTFVFEWRWAQEEQESEFDS